MQMAKIKMTAIIKCCRACGVTILSYTIDRKYKLMQTFGKWFGYEVEYIFVFTQRFCSSDYAGAQGGMLVML